MKNIYASIFSTNQPTHEVIPPHRIMGRDAATCAGPLMPGMPDYPPMPRISH